LTPMPYKTIALVPILTTYHNLQYHRLIWFHNRKYSGERAREQFGAAATVSRNLMVYAGFALLFGIIYQAPRQYILALEFRQSASWTVLATAFLWGFAFNHYYLDSKIWRVRRDPSVGLRWSRKSGRWSVVCIWREALPGSAGIPARIERVSAKKRCRL
jgi:hypothetical protein